MYRILGRYREALPLFAKVVEAQPRNERLASWLALAHIGVGDEAKAIQVLRAAGMSESDVTERMRELRSDIGPPR